MRMRGTCCRSWCVRAFVRSCVRALHMRALHMRALHMHTHVHAHVHMHIQVDSLQLLDVSTSAVDTSASLAQEWWEGDASVGRCAAGEDGHAWHLHA